MSNPLSRRAFIGTLSRDTAIDRARRKYAREETPLRPPGALDELEFLRTCTSCGECVQACPHGSLFVIKSENIADGTPVLSPADRPCHLCEELWCVAACEPNALQTDGALLSTWGHVELSQQHCFTFRGPECGACGGLCPSETRAIRFERQRPIVDVDACVGCGLCIEACPTSPVALRFVSRPLRTGGPS